MRVAWRVQNDTPNTIRQKIEHQGHGCDATKKFNMAAIATKNSSNHNSGLAFRIDLFSRLPCYNPGTGRLLAGLLLSLPWWMEAVTSAKLLVMMFKERLFGGGASGRRPRDMLHGKLRVSCVVKDARGQASPE